MTHVVFKIDFMISSSPIWEQENSDVDLIVSLPKGYDMFKQRLPLTEALEHAVGRKIDLIVKHELNKYLQDRILKEAKDL